MTTDPLHTLADRRPLVLGSGSPRRKMILTEAGLDFRQVVSDRPELRRPGEDPFDFGIRMAEEKARAVSKACDSNDLVISGDTVVVLSGQLLSKPTDRDDAIRMLNLLAGHQHTVGTSLALATDKIVLTSGIEKTQVYFNEVTREKIASYVDSGEPMDKAGAYGIQGMGAFLVDRIEGNLDNVVGLPMNLLYRLAREALTLL